MPRFNPRPSSLTGEPATPASTARCACSFNPRPSSLTGEPIVGVLARTKKPRFQSAPVIADGRTPWLMFARCCRSLAFQSAPVIADGRTHTKWTTCTQPCWFQSAPVIADGRTPPVCWHYAMSLTFQSAPVIADGRTQGAYLAGATTGDVSIRARHR